jgi:hypothetical protein
MVVHARIFMPLGHISASWPMCSRHTGLHSLHLWPGSFVTRSPFEMKKVAECFCLKVTQCNMCNMQ